MAGAGYKLFQTGDVLTAAQVNTYLNEQTVMVFANSTARTAALTSVLAEGMVSYLQDTNAVEVYDGSAWVGIGNSGDITGVTAGTGISGGGTSGTVTITNSMATEITAAGDIIVGTGSGTFDNLPIGTTGQVLTADTTVSPYKVKWATAASGSTLVGVQATLSSEQTVSSATYTAVTFNTETAGFDTDSFHDNSTNNSRFTVPSGKGGYYYMIGRVVVAGASSSWNNRCKIRKNGSTDLAFGYSNASTTGDVTTFVSCAANLSAGDYVEFVVYQGSGSNKNLQSNLSETGPTMFSMFKIGD